MGNRGSFSSRFGVVAAVGGSVIGLGNIWRFPYIAGENGELGVGKISVLMNAEVPTVENGSNMWMKVALATLVGFAAAVAIVFIRYITDDRIKTQEDILRSYNVPVLGVIPPEIIQ